MERRDRERFSFALLPRQALARDQVKRDIHHVKWLQAGGQLRHVDVVIVGESSERVCVAIRIGGAQIGTDQPAAIHGLKGKLIDIDIPGHHPAKRQEDEGKNHSIFRSSIFQKGLMMSPLQQDLMMPQTCMDAARLPENPVREYDQRDHDYQDEDWSSQFTGDLQKGSL